MQIVKKVNIYKEEILWIVLPIVTDSVGVAATIGRHHIRGSVEFLNRYFRQKKRLKQ